MFKSLLVASKPTGHQEYVAAHAVALANLLNARLTACTIIDERQIAPPEPMPIGTGIFKTQRNVELKEAARRTADCVLQACEAEADEAGVVCRADRFDGDVVDILSYRAHEFDLLVVGDTAADADGDESLIVRILKHVGRPTIVVPKHPPLGNDIVVAYDGSSQAARAVASFAYSGLGAGRAIHVVACAADAAAAATQAAVACRFLRRHGLSAHAELSADSPVAAITAAVVEHGAGLLVMGMFGKSALREFLLGSTTRAILQDLATATFLDR